MTRSSWGPRLAALALVAVLAPGARAQDAGVTIPFETYNLANGLRVILHRDASLPIAHVELWYHVGSKDEVKGRSGFAHLFEHLMFNGSQHADGEYFAPLTPLGADINGSTSSDRTNYYETLPTNGLQLALWLEADRMGYLPPALTQEKLDNQRDVVRNERRQRYEITPYGEVWVTLSEDMYPEGHPYHHTTIGSHEDLEAATLQDVKDFFATYYLPNNATLAVAGSFDVAEVKGWIEEYFGPLPAGPQPKVVTEADPGPFTPKTVELVDQVQLPRVVWAWRSPAFFAEGDAELDVLSLVLSDGKNSRLYKRLVFDDRIAKDVAAFQASAQLGSRYVVQATVAPGHTVEEVQRALAEEIARVVAEGVTAEEVQRTQNAWRKSFYQRIESVAGRAGTLLSYEHHVVDPGYIDRDLGRYLAVTPAAVQQWTARTLVDAARLEVIIRPEPKPAPGGEK